MSVALSGTITERLREAVGYMHKMRRRVVTVRRQIARREEPQIITRYQNANMRYPSNAEIDVLLDRVVGEHPDFKAAVANEQWGYRLTSAYALLRIAEQNDEIIGLLRAQLDELRRLGVEDRAP